MAAPPGERHGRSKLTDAQVRSIRYDRLMYGTTYMSISEQYGVSPGTVSALLAGRTWRHLLEPGDRGYGEESSC